MCGKRRYSQVVEITKGLKGEQTTSSEVLDDPIDFFLEFISNEISILFGVSYLSEPTTTTTERETYD